MSPTITISDEIAQHWQSLSFDQAQDIDEKLRQLLFAEYRRRLSHYSLTDRRLTEKYQMSFESFEQEQMTKQQGYSWEVETDAIAWETTVNNIQAIWRQLAELEQKP